MEHTTNENAGQGLITCWTRLEEDGIVFFSADGGVGYLWIPPKQEYRREWGHEAPFVLRRMFVFLLSKYGLGYNCNSRQPTMLSSIHERLLKLVKHVETRAIHADVSGLYEVNAGFVGEDGARQPRLMNIPRPA